MIVGNFFDRFYSIFIHDPDILKLFSSFSAWMFWTYIFLSTLGTIGFDTKPLLSLLSVAGITIGFAAKSLLANLFTGASLLFMRPFPYGSIITINGMKGKVISMDIRYLTLQSLTNKNEIIKIPVSIVNENTIIIEKDKHYVSTTTEI
jgi:small-conductance mechanosensitive channel